jgi:hypothetical protein
MAVQQERYEDFLGDLPKFAPDPRQDAFLSLVGPSGEPKKAMIDHRLGKVEIANVGRGWPASQANLGFLRDGVLRLAELGKLDPTSKKEIAQFVGWATQRVIRTTVIQDDVEIHIRFWTKDDHGVYGYEFSTPRGVD